METNYQVGHTIYWYGGTDHKVCSAEVLFVNNVAVHFLRSTIKL